MSKQLMAHLVYGYPTVKTSRHFYQQLRACKLDYIEVQIPFSDPIADGSILAIANSEAAQQVSTGDCLEFLLRMSHEVTKTHTVVMCYFQTIFSHGIESFCQQAAAAKVYGLIVPDLPYDQLEYQALMRATAANNLLVIPVLSPNMSLIRLKCYLTADTKMVYLTARTGITGIHTPEKDLTNLDNTVVTIKRLIPTGNIALGFGIQTVADIHSLPSSIDTVVVGSAITESLLKSGSDLTLEFVKKLQDACRTKSAIIEEKL